MSTKANRKRLTAEVRALIRASAKATAELAAEYGVSMTTIRRWQKRDDVADRSSRPNTVRTTLTPAQELEIIALRKTSKWSYRKLLAEVCEHVAPACSIGVLCRCLKRHGLIGQSVSSVSATHVPVRKGSPADPSSPGGNCMIPGRSRVSVSGPSNNISLSPSPPYTRTPHIPDSRNSEEPCSSTSNGPSGLSGPFGPDDLTHPSNWTGNTIGISDPSPNPAFPACLLEKSIDFVRLNHIGPEHEQTVFAFLKGNGFKVAYDGNNKNEKWKFARVRCYSVERNTTVLVYYRPTSPYFRTLWVQVMRPTRALLELLDSFFTGLGLSPRIRELELSFDFHTLMPGMMREFLVSHLFLKHQRSASRFYGDTFCTNNLGGTASGIRCYPKPRDDTFARFELDLSKGPVRRCGLGWLLDELDAFPLHKHFAFLEVDVDHVERSWAGRPTPVTNPPITHRERLARKMLRRVVESWLRTVPYEHFGLMAQIEFLKDRVNGLNKYERYLRPIPFNNTFFDAVSKLKFLP